MGNNRVLVSKLEDAFENSWKRTTSSDPDNWDEKNPAYGQCAVTAAVVQDYLGGRIEWRKIVVEDNEGFEDYFDEGEEVSHYINRVEGHNYDFTESQFPRESAVLFNSEEYFEKLEYHDCMRDYVLSDGPTRSRYEELGRRVSEYLEDEIAELT